MTTWSTVAGETTSYSTVTASVNSYSTVTAETATYIDYDDLNGYVDPRYFLAGYVYGDVWTVINGVSSIWVAA